MWEICSSLQHRGEMNTRFCIVKNRKNNSCKAGAVQEIFIENLIACVKAYFFIMIIKLATIIKLVA
jgi:hypothetical protein